MNCQISFSPEFVKQVKRLSKRYKSLGADIKLLAESLQETITAMIAVDATELLLFTIYDKSERDTITDAELKALRQKCGV